MYIFYNDYTFMTTGFHTKAIPKLTKENKQQTQYKMIK